MDKLQQFIDQHEEEVFTIGPVEEKKVKEAEASLGHPLPEELGEYLQRYGALSFRSAEFYGLGMKPSSHIHLVQQTLDLRSEKGFPSESVVIESLGDGHYAVCRPDGTLLEWGFPAYIGESEPLASSLEEYMLTRLKEA